MKRTVILFVIFTGLLTGSFLWKERIDINKRINDEKIGNFFAAFAGVATVVSIYFLYGQLIEMKESRKAANIPDLYPAYSKFSVKDVKGASFVGNKPATVARRMEDTGIIENERAFILLHNI